MSGQTSGFGSLCGILEGANTLLSLPGTALDLANMIQGDDGVSQILSQLSQMQTALLAGLTQIADEISLQTEYTAWTPVVTAINAAQVSISDYSKQMQLLDSTTWQVNVNGQLMSFRAWCEGTDGHGRTGAITELGDLIASLSDLFVTGGTVNYTTLQNWDSLCNAARTAGISGFTGQTNFTLTFQFMQELFSILTGIYTVREAALGMYQRLNYSGAFSYQPLSVQITQLFGDVNTPNTVWGVFDTHMKAYYMPPTTATPPPKPTPAALQDLSSTSCESYVGADNYTEMSSGGETLLHTVGVTTQSNCAGLQNVYFGQVQFATATSPIHGGSTVLYVEATPVVVGPNLTFTPQPPVSSYNPDGNNLLVLTSGGGTGPDLSYVNVGYSNYITPITDDQCSVLCGFMPKIYNGNQVGFVSCYGMLDVSDPANPTVTYNPNSWSMNAAYADFIAVYGWDTWDVDIDYVDLRPAGTLDLFPATSISFCQTMPPGGTAPGNRLGLALRNSWTGYRATFFQPSNAFKS